MPPGSHPGAAVLQDRAVLRGAKRASPDPSVTHTMRKVRTTLLVDGCTDRRLAVRTRLEREHESVVAAADAASALAQLAQTNPAVLVAAADLDGLTDLVATLHEREPLAQVVLLGPAPEGETAQAIVRRFGAVAWHEATDGLERLLVALESAFRVYDHAEQLQMTDRLKTELLANVSHELRTPLNVILGYLDLVREGTFGECAPEACEVLEKARGNASWLLDLVEEFLDFSHAEVGAAEIRRDAIEPAPLLRELTEAFGVLVREKPVRFVADVPDALPAVTADPAKVRVIVQNLLANAVKFTPRGQVRLTACAALQGGVLIAVEDTGPGIAPEHQEVVFDPFRQLEPASCAHRGVGLGLAIARRFARMMGGDLTVSSTVGTGSTFTLSLPPACRPEARSEAA
jgi:signal transduction histidine kinase